MLIYNVQITTLYYSTSEYFVHYIQNQNTHIEEAKDDKHYQTDTVQAAIKWEVLI